MVVSSYSMLFGSSIDLLNPHLPKFSFSILPVSVLILHCSLRLCAGYSIAVLSSPSARQTEIKSSVGEEIDNPEDLLVARTLCILIYTDRPRMLSDSFYGSFRYRNYNRRGRYLKPFATWKILALLTMPYQDTQNVATRQLRVEIWCYSGYMLW